MALAETIEALAHGVLTNYLHTPEVDRPRRKAEMTETTHHDDPRRNHGLHDE